MIYFIFVALLCRETCINEMYLRTKELNCWVTVDISSVTNSTYLYGRDPNDQINWSSSASCKIFFIWPRRILVEIEGTEEALRPEEQMYTYLEGSV